MAKRQTVSISIDAVENFIEKKGWSNSRFCKDIMGKGRGWISEWKRGANFPSPEEAAKMCVKFDCVPEDIIVDIEDQSIVSKILEKEKAPAPVTGAEAGEAKKAILNLIDDMSEDQLHKLETLIQAAKNVL